MSGEDIGELDLLAYVDNLLDPARRRAVEAHLADHPEAAERVALDLTISAAIRGLFAPTYDEAPPERLLALLQPAAQRDWRHAATLAASAVFLVLVGAMGGWWTAGQVPGEQMVQQLIDGSLPNGNLVPASAKGPNTPLAWLVDGLRRDLRVPDLRAQGFELVGESLIPRADRPIVRLIYADHGGRRLDLFLEPRWDKDLPMRVHDMGGRSLVAWGHGPAVFALTGSVPADDLQSLAAAIQTGADHGPPPGDPSIKPVAELPSAR